MSSANEKKQFHRYTKVFPAFALAVSLGGFALFYLIPFVISSVYAFTSNPIQMHFVGFKNFTDLFCNKFFLLGLKNTFLFMVFAIPLSMICALALALALKRLGRLGGFFSVIFLIPLVLPSATTVQFWWDIFADNGVLNGLLYHIGIEGPLWLESNSAMGALIFIFIWKNLGYNTILFLTGLHAIPEIYYSCAAVFGANGWQRLWHVTLACLTPTFFLVFIMSFVNSFKIFREVYLLQGEFPHESVYLLQHFVNSTLLSLHYHRLVSAVYVLTFVISLVVLITFKLESRSYQNMRE